jgi:hypothetical protein
MFAVTSLPSLSQVETLDTSYLFEAQQYWTHTGNLWDQVFTEIHDKMSTPGGAPWKGQAATAGQERAYLDMVKVRGAAFQLHEAAGIARGGDAQLQACKDEVLEAVRDAQGDGFEVGDDYSVIERLPGGSAELRAERRARADGHAAFIRHRVAALVATDQEITTKITAATERIGNLTFHETPAGVDDTIVRHDKDKVVQRVDDHWKQEPTPIPEPGPTNGPSAEDIRRVLDQLPAGSKPQIREVRSQQDLDNLWNWMEQNGVERPGGYGTVPGEMKGLPDGTIVGRREAADSTKQPALDVRLPGEEGYTKVHINPRGGVPDLPAPAGPASPEATEPGRATVKAPPATAKPVETPPLHDEVPKFPFGPGLTGHEPATGPHPVYGPHHHSLEPPLLGEEPDEVP